MTGTETQWKERQPCDVHISSRWEVNEKTQIFTRRCATCGDILEQLTFDEVRKIKNNVIQLKDWLLLRQLDEVSP